MSREANQATVLYDGHCKFCLSQIKNLRRLDLTKHLRFVSLHDPEVSKLYPDLSYEQLMEQMWVVSPKGNRYGGAYALRYLSRSLPLLWPIAPAMHFPGLMPLWSRLYHWVAERRYQIAGRNCSEGTCSLHGHRASKK